jgi:Fe-S cluster assembly protein SufB
MMRPTQRLDESSHPDDILANAVEELSIGHSEPEWLARSRRQALDAYLSAAPVENRRLVSRQILTGRSPADTPGMQFNHSRPSLGAAGDSASARRALEAALHAQGVILIDLHVAVRDHEDFVREHLGSLVDPASRWTEALNIALWSGGHLVYVPDFVRVETPIQPYDRTNASRIRPFERTLIVAGSGSSLGFIEGCSAPIYAADSFRSPMTEVVILEGASVNHMTIQNYMKNVTGIVNRRARVVEGGSMAWVEGNLGSDSSVGVPVIDLMGSGARGEITSLSLVGPDSGPRDSGGDVLLRQPGTSARIVTKSLRAGPAQAPRSRISLVGDGKPGGRDVELVLESMTIGESMAAMPQADRMESDSTTAGILTSGDAVDSLRIATSESSDIALRVDGWRDAVESFIDPVARLLPVEYSVELNRMIELLFGGWGER